MELSYEYNNSDNEIFNRLYLTQIFDFLETLGYNNRFVDTQYMCYEHYKQLFHYSLIKQYNIDQVFLNTDRPYGYNRYNSLLITGDTNVSYTGDFLFGIFKKVKTPICIFIDFKSLKIPNYYHTTLLIYRPENKTIEHFDSNGIFKFGNISIFYEIMDRIIENDLSIRFIDSKKVSALENYSDSEARARGLNVVCGMVGKKDIGWCQIWSLFVYEMINKFPEYNTRNIMILLYSQFKGKKFKDAGFKALNIIRGYYRILLGRLNLYLSEIGVQITNEILTEYNPNFVINDKKVDNMITEFLDDKIIGIYDE